MGSALMVEVPGMERTGALCVRPVAGLDDELRFCVARRAGDESTLVLNFLAVVEQGRNESPQPNQLPG